MDKKTISKLSKYCQIRDRMKTGDLIQWHTDSFVGAGIRLFSNSTVNHSGLVIRLDEYDGLQDRIFTLEAIGKGVSLSLLSKKIVAHNGSAWWYPLKDDCDPYRDSIAKWALAQVGQAYDYKSIFKQILGRVSADAEKLFCSEYVYLAYKEAGISMKEQKAPRPCDMPGLKLFKKATKII